MGLGEAEKAAVGVNIEQLGGFVAPLLQEGPGPHPPLQDTQLLPFHTSGKVQALQAGGLFAPFPQDAHETMTGCQLPQLLFRLDSGTDPPHAELKFAQTRTLYVPGDANVYEPETVVAAPAESDATVFADTSATFALKLLFFI